MVANLVAHSEMPLVGDLGVMTDNESAKSMAEQMVDMWESQQA